MEPAYDVVMALDRANGTQLVPGSMRARLLAGLSARAPEPQTGGAPKGGGQPFSATARLGAAALVVAINCVIGSLLG